MQYRVYRYIFPDGKIYIGMTGKKIQERRDNGYNHNKPLQTAIRETGWRKMKVDILTECETAEEAFSEEKRLIAEHNSTNPAIGYNKSYGGKSTFEGLSHTKEHKEYMSKKLKGKTWSAESLEKMRKGHEKERHPVLKIGESGETLQYFESLREAAKAVNGHASNISRACKKRGSKYKGYSWEYAKIERGDDGCCILET